MSAPDPTRPSALLTDLYELTMAAAYFENRFNPVASFELFVRSLPPDRGYLLAAGLEQGLDYLETLTFTDSDVDFLRRHPVFSDVSDAFFDSLRHLRFTGEVWAAPEGTVVFADEPLLRVTAPLMEAQIVETILLTTLAFQTLIATKAARVVEAAGGRGVVEFGTRRAHGPEAGVLAARAAYIGGCIGTSNLETSRRFGIPTYGTVAHSFVMAYEDEEESFRRFLRVFPEHAILLVDTYDTLAAVDRILESGLRPRGVRLDSGNLVELSKEVRRRLDKGGLSDTKIFASGDLNEYAIEEALAQGAAIDAFGVGTELATSKDAPALGAVYKLVAVHDSPENGARVKLSEDKATYPGTKQVFRFRDAAGLFDHDLVARADEQFPDGESLLACVLRDGRRFGPSPSLEEIRGRTKGNLERLPARYHAFRNPPAYPVRFSRALRDLREEARQKVLQPAGGAAMAARRPIIFWDVDTQVDFINPDGKLYVPGAEKLIPNWKRLTDFAAQNGILVLGDVDAHLPTDEEFTVYPPHCLAGTPGQQKIPETILSRQYILPNRKVELPPDLSAYQQVILEKQTLDAFSNPNADDLLRRVGREPEVAVYGVVTECCVDLVARGLIERGYRVRLITDAIRHWDEEKARVTLRLVEGKGELVTTDQVLADYA